MPVVSVIVPVYGVEDYLDACLESILAQSHHDLEVILVDDGSPDASPGLCDAWAERDPRVRVVHQPNGGVSAARNVGLDVATGDCVTFVDGDDVVAPDLVDSLLRLVAQHHAQVAAVAYVPFAAGAPDYRPGTTLELGSGNETLWRIVGEKARWEVWGKLYRRDLFADTRFRTDIRNGEDLELLARVLPAVRTAVLCDARLYGYRVREDGAMGASRLGPPADIITAVAAVIDLAKGLHGPDSPEYQRLFVAYLLLAAGKLESIVTWQSWRASDGYRRAYRELLREHRDDVRSSDALSRPYKVALVLSRRSPTAFVAAFRVVRLLKRFVPSLRRRPVPAGGGRRRSACR